MTIIERGAQTIAGTPRNIADLPGPRGMPLLGNMLQIDSLRLHRILEDWAAVYGPYYRVQVGRKPMVVVSDNATIARLLRERPEVIRRSSRVADALNELGAYGVFTAEGEEWRKQRKLVMRALTPEVVRNFFPTLVTLTERMRQRWQAEVQAGRRVDLQRDLKAFALDVTVSLAMGQDINTLERTDNPLQRDIDAIFKCLARRLVSPFPYWRYIRLSADRAVDACAERVAQAIAGFIGEARERMLANPELRNKPSNMLEALIVARDEPGSGFTDQHVIGNAITMVFAGEDTTSNTLAWLFDFVARHAQAAARLQVESDAVLGGARALREFGMLEQFPYIDAAVTEAMRIKPVAPIMGMQTNTELVLGDLVVPPNTLIMSLLRHSALLATDLSEPQAFRPERWEAGVAVNDTARKLFPFGGGPRFCPGRYLALAEIKMVMSMVARNFVLMLDADAPPPQELYTFTMTPQSLPVRLQGR